MAAQSSHRWTLQPALAVPPLTTRHLDLSCARTFFRAPSGKAPEFFVRCKPLSRTQDTGWRVPRSAGFKCFARLHIQAVLRHEEPELPADSGSFFGSIIEKALHAYVRAQLETCAELKISVAGRNQELLTGQVKGVRVFAKGVVYKGLALTIVDMTSSPLTFQFGGNKPLLQPFSVIASIGIQEKDLNTSLSSPLISGALTDILPQQWNLSSGIPELSVSVRDGFLQLWGPKSGKPVGLCLEVKDEGRTLHVYSVDSTRPGERKTDLVERQFGMSGVQICKLDVVTPLVSVTGEFEVTP